MVSGDDDVAVEVVVNTLGAAHNVGGRPQHKRTYPLRKQSLDTLITEISPQK